MDRGGPTCRGHARSTGQRCRITWGLDADGYCANHRGARSAPPPPPPPPPLPQCRGATKHGLRCRINWGLNDDGFCQHHTSQASNALPPPPLPSLPPPPPPPLPPHEETPACRGFARSTGHRCRITWDLNALGYCKYHTAQAPAPKPKKAPPRTCSGTTKQGRPCGITWQLDALGFCKYHTQLTSRCQGVAVSTGQRCRIRWDLDAHGFCKYHAAKALAAVAETQCVAVAQSTGVRCRITIGLDASGLCSVHQRTRHAMVLSSPNTQPSTRQVCKGFVLHTGAPCTNDAKRDYAYCCAAHDPSLPYFSPRLFDAADKPRSLLEPQVVRLYHGRDLYHGDLLDLVTPGYVELDHIFEKQCFSFAFHKIPFANIESDAAYLASIVRDQFANELTNLCLTRTTTNKIKGSAVWKFLDDAITSDVSGTVWNSTFTDYVLAEQRDEKRLDRETTRVIRREMGRSLKQCRYKLAEQGETPLVEQLSQQLQQVYVTMDLYTSPSTPTTKFDASAKPTDSSTSSTSDADEVRHGPDHGINRRRDFSDPTAATFAAVDVETAPGTDVGKADQLCNKQRGPTTDPSTVPDVQQLASSTGDSPHVAITTSTEVDHFKSPRANVHQRDVSADASLVVESQPTQAESLDTLRNTTSETSASGDAESPDELAEGAEDQPWETVEIGDAKSTPCSTTSSSDDGGGDCSTREPSEGAR